MNPEETNNFLKKLILLYVEDDDEARDQLSRFLGRRCGELITASSGMLGLEAFQSRRPHLVVTDIQMPKMDGLEMAAEIRRLDPNVPIIVVTAFEQTDYLMRSIDIGIDKYVTKPVNPDRLHAAMLECAGRLHTEKQLNLAARVFENSQEAIVVTDSENVIVSVNHAFTRITGYTADESLGKTPRFLSSERHDKAFYEKMWKAITSEKCWQGEIWCKRKNGEVYPEWLSITATLDDAGRVIHHIGIFSDISERRHLEEQLRQSQKMEAVGMLAGGVAHDFNNILMVIIGYCDMLKLNMRDDDVQQYKVDQVIKAANRASQLTSGLLAFSRKQIMNSQKADLNRIVADGEKFLRRIIGEDIRFSTVLADNPLNVNVDSGQITQVLVNLVTNARDSMPQGGDLTIETSIQNLDETFVRMHGYGSVGKYAVMQVSDTGRGMDEKTRLRIFEPFFTTKEIGKGTGLGMAIVYGIIKQHNGYINVYSEPEQGTLFRIYLPVISREQPDEEETAVPVSPQRGTETILVVEDDESVRNLEASILQKFGYQVITAVDGQDGIDKFKENREEIKLVVMDIIMPQKSGKQASDEIRMIQPGIRVLFTSGYPADIVQSRGEIDEGAELVMKPLNASELLAKIRNILDRQHPPEPAEGSRQ